MVRAGVSSQVPEVRVRSQKLDPRVRTGIRGQMPETRVTAQSQRSESRVRQDRSRAGSKAGAGARLRTSRRRSCGSYGQMF